MRNNNQIEASRWFEQAEHDLRSAEWSAKGGFFEDACFKSQQAAEKAFKAVCYRRGERNVVGHSNRDLVLRCQRYNPDFNQLLPFCNLLDRHYISSRYPNGLPSGTPHDYYDEMAANEAMEAARRIIDFVGAFQNLDL